MAFSWVYSLEKMCIVQPLTGLNNSDQYMELCLNYSDLLSSTTNRNIQLAPWSGLVKLIGICSKGPSRTSYHQGPLPGLYPIWSPWAQTAVPASTSVRTRSQSGQGILVACESRASSGLTHFQGYHCYWELGPDSDGQL